jgi:hypothetical protein
MRDIDLYAQILGHVARDEAAPLECPSASKRCWTTTRASGEPPLFLGHPFGK